MSIKEQIMADVKSAMKAKEQEKLSALRLLSAALKNKEIELRPEALTDQDAMSVIKKLVKQRQDSIEQYSAAGRTDLADKEKFELSILEAYLPAQMSKEQIAKIVEEVVAATGASSMKDMGNVMKQITEKTQGQADNKMVSELVKARLQ